MITLFIVLGCFLLEGILLWLLSIPRVEKWIKTIKNKIRHWFWKYFDWKNDFVEKN